MNGAVTRNENLGEGWWLLEVAAPEIAAKARAGQFVQVRIGDGDAPLLRRPFSVYDVLPAPGVRGERIQILYQRVGPGTRWMASLAPRDAVDCLGPLGKPFPALAAGSGDAIFLVGGGIGVAPLHLYCREVREGVRKEVTADSLRVLLGARRASLLVGRAAFERLALPLFTATDDGSAGYRGNVVALLEREIGSHSGRVRGIGCGPHGMNMALRNFAVARSLEFWISLENFMPCGFGACFGCVIRIPGDGPARYRRVCVDGPAFPAAEIPAETVAH